MIEAFVDAYGDEDIATNDDAALSAARCSASSSTTKASLPLARMTDLLTPTGTRFVER